MVVSTKLKFHKKSNYDKDPVAAIIISKSKAILLSLYEKAFMLNLSLLLLTYVILVVIFVAIAQYEYE